jgi:hypothetical protein
MLTSSAWIRTRRSRDQRRMQFVHPGRQYTVMGFGTMLTTGKPKIATDPSKRHASDPGGRAARAGFLRSGRLR